MRNLGVQLYGLVGKTDLVILPEMFTTGFSMNPEALAEGMEDDTVRWMKRQAEILNAAIVGSFIYEEKSDFFNRLISVKPDGELDIYDKRHLFRIGDEHFHYKAGNQFLIVSWGGWRIRPLICYDLRFPVWARYRGDYDLLVYIANWPESRRKVWKALLIARAIENQVYTIGVNRIGKDGRDIGYTGDSMVIDPKGETIFKANSNEESIQTVELSLEAQNEFREKFPVALDADDFEMKI